MARSAASARTRARTRTGRPTRSEAEQLEKRLRRAAVDTFLERGFDGATMEEVARAAGVTKRTLYARYADKHALFADVIPWALARQHSAEPPPATARAPRAGDLAGALTAIARAAVARAVDPQIVQLTRLAMNEAPRFPEFATSAHSLAWSPRMQAVIEVLERHAADGRVAVDDVELAAEQFLAMVSLMPARLAAFGVRRTREDEDRHIRHAVKLFVRGVLAR